MHDLLLPYVPADSPVPVRGTVRGEQRDGMVLGWRGGRVYVRTSTGPGMSYLGWVPAADVERR